MPKCSASYSIAYKTSALCVGRWLVALLSVLGWAVTQALAAPPISAPNWSTPSLLGDTATTASISQYTSTVPKVVRLPSCPTPETTQSSLQHDPNVEPSSYHVELEARIGRLEAELEAIKRVNFPGPSRPEPNTGRARLAGFTVEPDSHPCPECGCEDHCLPNHCEQCEICLPECWQYRLADILSKPEYPTVQWKGFLQLDIGWISQDAANEATVGVVNSSTGLRRVRLAVYGDVRETISYLVDLDFAADGHPSFRDVVLNIHDTGLTRSMLFGYFQQPFGLDAMTSGKELLLLERQLPFAFAPFRQTGLGPYGVIGEGQGTWALSAYRFPTDSFGVNIGDSGGWAVATRATYLLLDQYDGERLVHTGLGYSFGDPGNNVVRYAIEPGFFVTDPTVSDSGSSVPAFVDTGDIPTSSFNLLNGEFGVNLGALSVQSELRASLVDQIGAPNPSFWGAYVTLAYVLNGETHPYDRSRGTFRRVVPVQDYQWGCGGGAWEMVASWGYIDLDDENITGGKMHSVILGVNRYLNRFTKFQFNVGRILLEDSTVGRSAATTAAMRVQVEF